mgnify:CR=1 FL=1
MVSKAAGATTWKRAQELMREYGLVLTPDEISSDRACWSVYAYGASVFGAEWGATPEAAVEAYVRAHALETFGEPATRTEEEARAYCEEHGIPYAFGPDGDVTGTPVYEIGRVGEIVARTSVALALDAYLAAHLETTPDNEEPLPQTVGECAEWCWERGMYFRFFPTVEVTRSKKRCYIRLDGGEFDYHVEEATPAEAVAVYVARYGVPSTMEDHDE